MPSPNNSTTDIKEPMTEVRSVDERRPEALRGMSDDEIAAIEKKLVRKADLVIL